MSVVQRTMEKCKTWWFDWAGAWTGRNPGPKDNPFSAEWRHPRWEQYRWHFLLDRLQASAHTKTGIILSTAELHHLIEERKPSLRYFRPAQGMDQAAADALLKMLLQRHLMKQTAILSTFQSETLFKWLFAKSGWNLIYIIRKSLIF